MKEVIIVGAGAHSKVIIDIIQESNEFAIKGLIDEHVGQELVGIPIIGNDDMLTQLYNENVRYAFVAIGNNQVRKKIQRRLQEIGYELINAISKGAIISKSVSIGVGVAIMPGAVINTQAKIKDGCIINTAATIDHDTVINSFAHIAPGTHVCGSSSIGEVSFLGVGTNVIDKVSVGDNTIIGAGSTVICNIPSNCTAVGTPAKIIKRS